MVAFALLNGILYLAQELWHVPAKRKVVALSTQLVELKTLIDSLTDSLQPGVTGEMKVDSLGVQVELGRKAFASDVAYRNALATYTSSVDEWNSRLPTLQQRAVVHDSLVDRYNSVVTERNRLASKAYTRWWLLPIPVPGSAARAASSSR